MKLDIRGHLTDVITCVTFLVDRFRGYRVLTPPKLPFSIDLLRRPYNSVRTAVRQCDQASVSKQNRTCTCILFTQENSCGILNFT